jgi:hypothetical protein
MQPSSQIDRRLLHLAEHGDIAAEAHCLQNACSHGRSADRRLEV